MKEHNLHSIGFLGWTTLVIALLFAAALGPEQMNTHPLDAKRLLHFSGYSALLVGLFLWLSPSRVLRALFLAFIIADMLGRKTYGAGLSLSVWMSVLHAPLDELRAYIAGNIAAVALGTSILLLALLSPRIKAPRLVTFSLLALGLTYTFAPLAIDVSSQRSQPDPLRQQTELQARALGESNLEAQLYYAARTLAYRIPPSESFVGILKSAAYIVRGSRAEVAQWSDVRSSATNPKLMVLVIGESLRADHMSLYGYRRETTPRLEAIADQLQVASAAFASGTNTWNSLPSLLMKTGENKQRGPSLIQLANAAGYETIWISAQQQFDSWGISVSQIAYQADTQIFIQESTASPVYDEALLPILEQHLKARKTGDKTLVILHLLGSHSMFEDRFPPNHAHFSDQEIPSKKERDIAAYDDSVRYTDYISGRVIDEISPLGGELMFVADHGLLNTKEDLYLRHDVRAVPDKDSLLVPLIYYGNKQAVLEEGRPYSLFYFECVFSNWVGITATELTQDDYCQTNLQSREILFYDASMTLRSFKHGAP